MCWGAAGTGCVSNVNEPHVVARSHSLLGTEAWWDGECDPSGITSVTASLQGVQSVVVGAEVREMLGVPHGMVPGLSVGTGRA